MKLILEIIEPASEGVAIYSVIEKFPAVLGRGYHNDIILQDPHVSANHLRLDLGDGQWWAHDLGSDNGVWLNGAWLAGGSKPLKSGDVLRAGKTEIRIFSPDHPVSPAALLQKNSKFFSFLSQPLNAWACFAASVALVSLWTYAEIWSDEPGLQAAVAAGAMTCLVMIWAGLWSAAGRLIKRKSHFQAHVALISLYMFFSVLFSYIQSYADFLTSQGIFATALGYAGNLAMLVCLIYGALALAAEMQKKRRFFAAFYFSAGLLTSVFGFGMAEAQSFSESPPFAATLEPYLSGLAPADSLEVFMNNNRDIFTADALEIPVTAPEMPAADSQTPAAAPRDGH